MWPNKRTHLNDEEFVNLLYHVFLGRDADTRAASHLSRLKAGSLNHEELALEFLRSDECRTKALSADGPRTPLLPTSSTGLGDRDPARTDCVFYHTMELPGEDVIKGFWDIRGRFDEYVGGIPLHGKSVLDVGTATGFLAFEAEKRGARVTAFDIDSGSYQTNVPFTGNLYHEDRDAWISGANINLRGLHNSFWYCHKRYNSKVRAIYGSFNDLLRRGETFDVVTCGAVFEHLSDPVTALGILSKLARETMVIAWTPIVWSEDIFMRILSKLARETMVIAWTPIVWSEDIFIRPCVPWNNPSVDFSWYEMSVGMYRRLLANVGWRIQAIHFVNAFYLIENVMAERPSIVCRRVV
jgi:2-polyprenyl-3-methyl-5-hydroxy-6-metoxy-1,4-benzoquinol methylase